MPQFPSQHLDMPGLGQGHNQKKDTHTLDFDVTLPLGLKQLTSLIFPPRFLGKKRFNDRSKGFPFGQQPVRALYKHWGLPLPLDKTAEGARRFMFNCLHPFLRGLPHTLSRENSCRILEYFLERLTMLINLWQKSIIIGI